MWNELLIAYARIYPSGVLTVVEDSGYPLSVRCVVEFDDAREPLPSWWLCIVGFVIDIITNCLTVSHQE